MPPPPPPPGPPPGPPGPPRPPPIKVGGGGGKPNSSKPNDRGALLKSIQQGKALKKTVTNDRSAPIVGGGSKPNSNSNNDMNANNNRSPGRSAPVTPAGGDRNGGSSNNGAPPPTRLPGIGGLFDGGFPDRTMLKPVGNNPGAKGMNDRSIDYNLSITYVLKVFQLIFLKYNKLLYNINMSSKNKSEIRIP